MEKQINQSLLKHIAIITFIVCFSVLIFISVKSYTDAPPIPEKIIDEKGNTIITKDDILKGQEVFLKYGLHENGTIWGHGAYLGPDFSAEYLYNLYNDAIEFMAKAEYGKNFSELNNEDKEKIKNKVAKLLKTNRYNSETRILVYTDAEVLSFTKQIKTWENYFGVPSLNFGLKENLIQDKDELRSLVAFFSWTAWASVANRPGKNYSYTNNFPYFPELENKPTLDAYMWSALSLIALLGMLALALFVFGRFDYLGWKGKDGHAHPTLIPGEPNQIQSSTLKFFVISLILFLLQVFAGGAVAHYRADPTSFYGFKIFNILPSNILRTWHIQLAIFWVAIAYVGGAIFIASTFAEKINYEKFVRLINIVFSLLFITVVGSLLGEYLGVNNLMGKLWFLFGHQGWEYLDLGRGWQILLAISLLIWLFILINLIRPGLKDNDTKEVVSLFIYSAIAIPIFYAPALFFNHSSHYTVVDTWRFWIIHLWVEGFFEVFLTSIVAIIFYKLDIISPKTAARVVYLDALLYLGSGIVGTGHHWYWTGQTNITMALGAMFSAMEVVPLTLLTLEAWDFIKLTSTKCDICGQKVNIPHKWTFYFLMSVGFWNFVGAGIFGFLINLPIISYFEVGTMLTSNHGHTAMMGVFGMLAISLIVFGMRQILDEKNWNRIEKYVKTSFWTLNVGLALMSILTLFPGGILQLKAVIEKGYRFARSSEFASNELMKLIEWLRLPADLIFISGVVSITIAGLIAYKIHKSKSNYVKH